MRSQLRGEAADVCARGPDRPARPQAVARPAHRARRLRRRAGGASDDTDVRLRDWSLRTRRRAPTQRTCAGRRISRSTCVSRRRSRCCCKATAGLSRKGPDASAGQLLLQPAAAGHRAAACRCRAALRQSTGHGLARPRMERGAAAPRSRGLGLDRHEPGRRQRAHGLPAAPQGRHARCGTAARSAARDGELRTSSSPARPRSTPQRRWTSPRTSATYPVDWLVRTPADIFTVRAAARRPGARQPRLHRRRLLGRPVRPVRRAAAGASGGAIWR